MSMSKYDAGMPASRKHIAASEREANSWTELVSHYRSEEKLGASDRFLQMLCECAKGWQDDRRRMNRRCSVVVV
jgi:hypothetical protein